MAWPGAAASCDVNCKDDHEVEPFIGVEANATGQTAACLTYSAAVGFPRADRDHARTMLNQAPMAPSGERIIPRFRVPGLVLFATVAYGTIGYMVLVQGASVIDGMYWTVLTLGGVGYRDTFVLGEGAEAFSISLIVMLLISVALFVGAGSNLVASGDLTRRVRRRRVVRSLDALSNHVIVCGDGRVGRAAVTDLQVDGTPVSVVDNDPRHEEALVDAGVPHLISEPEHESVLRRLGIERARGLICAVDSDAVNVYITLTARALCPNITIVARASDPDSIEVLQRAGADSVVSPYIVSGKQMADMGRQAHQESPAQSA